MDKVAVAVSFVSHLVDNSTLQKLHISRRDEFSTFLLDGYRFDTVLSRVLWDKSQSVQSCIPASLQSL
jgi:hypothetical protein